MRFKRSEATSILLTFGVKVDGTSSIIAAGTINGANQAVVVNGGSGWDPNGVGNVMKCVTSIAQKSGQQNLSSGAGVSEVVWYNMTLGGTSSAADWSGNTQYHCFYPDQNKVYLNPDSFVDYLEYVTIQL